MNVELFLDAHAVIAETPLWDAAEGALYWADIKGRTLNRIALSRQGRRSWSLPDEIGGFALGPEGSNFALVALRTGLFRLDFRSGGVELLAPPPFDPDVMRFNESACDPDGRFFIGVMFDPRPGVDGSRSEGALHSFRLGERLREEPDRSDLHNGMAFSPDGRRFYLSHTYQRRIYVFERNGAGRIGERRLFAELPPGPGAPDGAALDAEGGYWCAVHKGWALRRYRPDGGLDLEVPLPVSQPTMCAFAGARLEHLIVTSASDALSPEDLEREPHAGALFILSPKIPGVPRRVRIAPAAEAGGPA